MVIAMMASTVPWAPIVAFMVCSPISSPTSLMLSAGLFGWPFAIAMFASSLTLGLGAGALADLLDRRGMLANQARLTLAPGAERSAPSPAKVEGRETPRLAAQTLAVAAVPGGVRPGGTTAPT